MNDGFLYGNDIIEKLQEVRLMDTLEKLNKFIINEFNFIWDEGRQPIVVEDSGSAHAVQLAISYIQQRYNVRSYINDILKRYSPFSNVVERDRESLCS